MSDETPKYDASSIQSLTGREHVRKRPGMYVGGPGPDALYVLLYEVVDNAVNQALQKGGGQIVVILQDDFQVTVQDDGEGVPVEIHDKTGISILELIFTQMGACQWRGERHVKRSGIGVAPVNALSEKLAVEVKRDGYVWWMNFAHGLPTTSLQQVRPLETDERTGTTITFKPDFDILERHEFDYVKIHQRLHEYAYMIPELTAILEDKRTNSQGELSTTIHHPRGLAEYVEYLNQEYEALHPVIHLQKTMEFLWHPEKSETYEVTVDLALQYGTCPETRIVGFVNTMHIASNSIALSPITKLTANELRNYAIAEHLVDDGIASKKLDYLRGLMVVINIWHPDPQTENSMRFQLINPSASETVHGAMQAVFDGLQSSQPEALQKIIKHILESIEE